VIDCHQSKEDTDSGTQQHGIGRLGAHNSRNRYDRPAGQRRDRIKIAFQNERNISGKDITGHTAADTGQHAQDRRHHGINAVIQCLLCTDDRKQTKSNSVEQQDLSLGDATFGYQ
jgi:hypothetical protein